LFGSDHPLELYPQESAELAGISSLQRFTSELSSADLAPDAREAVMGGNSARLLGLKDGPKKSS
jgi:hypothetical protein